MDDSAFIRTIIDNPDDDGLRLVYADWLEEHGDPRGEFIRVQCELARTSLSPVKSIEVAKRVQFLQGRERELLNKNGHCWLPRLGLRWMSMPREDSLAIGCGIVGRESLARIPRYDDFIFSFRRGFIERISCPWLDWSQHAAAILAATPVRTVRLTTRPEIGIRDGFVWWVDCDGQHKGPKIDYDNDNCGLKGLCEKNWPGIEFELPRPEPVTEINELRIGSQVVHLNPPITLRQGETLNYQVTDGTVRVLDNGRVVAEVPSQVGDTISVSASAFGYE